jgi:hypothetical protein
MYDEAVDRRVADVRHTEHGGHVLALAHQIRAVPSRLRVLLRARGELCRVRFVRSRGGGGGRGGEASREDRAAHGKTGETADHHGNPRA